MIGTDTDKRVQVLGIVALWHCGWSSTKFQGLLDIVTNLIEAHRWKKNQSENQYESTTETKAGGVLSMDIYGHPWTMFVQEHTWLLVPERSTGILQPYFRCLSRLINGHDRWTGPTGLVVERCANILTHSSFRRNFESWVILLLTSFETCRLIREVKSASSSDEATRKTASSSLQFQRILRM